MARATGPFPVRGLEVRSGPVACLCLYKIRRCLETVAVSSPPKEIFGGWGSKRLLALSKTGYIRDVHDEQESVVVLAVTPRIGGWWEHAASQLENNPEEVPEQVCERMRTLARERVSTAPMSRAEASAIRDWANGLPGWEDEPGLEFRWHPSQRRLDWRDL